MKKRMSAAGLGLQLTFRPVMFVIVFWSAIQLWCFFQSKPYWIHESYVNPMAFEDILDNQGIYFYGKSSFLMILAATLIIPKNKAAYTLRRLRISEKELTAGWALVFSGYYLVSWAVQLLLTMGMFRAYAGTAGLDALDYFQASYRSRYLHLLLPLGEPWGYIRNGMICLGWGTMGALIGRHCRHGAKPYMVIAPVILTLMFLPGEMASQTADIWFCVLMVLLVSLQRWMIREVERDED